MKRVLYNIANLNFFYLFALFQIYANILYANDVPTDDRQKIQQKKAVSEYHVELNIFAAQERFFAGAPSIPTNGINSPLVDRLSAVMLYVNGGSLPYKFDDPVDTQTQMRNSIRIKHKEEFVIFTGTALRSKAPVRDRVQDPSSQGHCTSGYVTRNAGCSSQVSADQPKLQFLPGDNVYAGIRHSPTFASLLIGRESTSEKWSAAQGSPSPLTGVHFIVENESFRVRVTPYFVPTLSKHYIKDPSTPLSFYPMNVFDTIKRYAEDLDSFNNNRNASGERVDAALTFLNIILAFDWTRLRLSQSSGRVESPRLDHLEIGGIGIGYRREFSFVRLLEVYVHADSSRGTFQTVHKNTNGKQEVASGGNSLKTGIRIHLPKDDFDLKFYLPQSGRISKGSLIQERENPGYLTYDPFFSETPLLAGAFNTSSSPSLCYNTDLCDTLYRRSSLPGYRDHASLLSFQWVHYFDDIHAGLGATLFTPLLQYQEPSLRTMKRDPKQDRFFEGMAEVGWKKKDMGWFRIQASVLVQESGKTRKRKQAAEGVYIATGVYL